MQEEGKTKQNATKGRPKLHEVLNNPAFFDITIKAFGIFKQSEGIKWTASCDKCFSWPVYVIIPNQPSVLVKFYPAASFETDASVVFLHITKFCGDDDL